MIAERMLFRGGHCHVRFSPPGVFSTWSFPFFGEMVSAALWFFDSLIFCSGALIGYISSFHSFSSFLLVGRRGAGALTSPFLISSEMRFLLR